jgi:hypothetical protein
MKTCYTALIAAGAVLTLAEPAFAVGPPAGVTMGPPAFVTHGPPAGVTQGPPAHALAHIPAGVPLGKPADPSAVGTTVRDSARANRAALDHANAQAFAHANANAGLVMEDTTTPTTPTTP